MDQQQYDQALTILLAAENLYAKRPEALLNIGSIYANKGDPDKAEEAFAKAAAAAQGELVAKLDTATQQQWKKYVEMSTLNIAQIRGQKGVELFQAEDFDGAAQAFARAAEVNPYSRDYLYNYIQARYAKSTKLEEELEADKTKLDAHKPVLLEIYSKLLTDIPKVRTYDPTNETLLLIQGRAVRRQGELQGDTLAARQAALKLYEQADAIPVEVLDLQITTEESTATVAGKLRNKKANPGTPVTIKVTLLGYKGDAIGQMTVTVNAGPSGEGAEPVTFTQTGEVKGTVAGWKYEVSS
jgi:tetratricopeptide (TPR) repeat protein